MKKLRIGIDLDNTITAFPIFFKTFSAAMKYMGCKIYIITNREPGTEDNIINELNELGIIYDVIKITPYKSQYIMKQGINVYIDDTDEYFVDLPENICVFKIREPGNFDYKSRKWI